MTLRLYISSAVPAWPETLPDGTVYTRPFTATSAVPKNTLVRGYGRAQAVTSNQRWQVTIASGATAWCGFAVSEPLAAGISFNGAKVSGCCDINIQGGNKANVAALYLVSAKHVVTALTGTITGNFNNGASGPRRMFASGGTTLNNATSALYDRLVLWFGATSTLGSSSIVSLLETTSGASDCSDGGSTALNSAWIEFDNTPTFVAYPSASRTIYGGWPLQAQSPNIVAPDTTPPVIGASTPASGSAIARTGAVTLPISDDVEVASVRAWAAYAHAPAGTPPVLVFDGASSCAGFAGSDFSGGTLTLVRDGLGHSDDVTFTVVAADTASNESTADFSFTITGYPFTPVIGASTPASGSEVEREEAIEIPISAPEGVADVIAWFVPLTGTPELVFDGAEFVGAWDSDESDYDDASAYSQTLTIQRASPGLKQDGTFHVEVTDERGGFDEADYAFTVDGDGVFGPTIDDVSPAAGSRIGPLQVFRFTARDDTGFAAVTISVEFPQIAGVRERQTIWEPGGFSDRYKTSTVNVVSDTEWEFTIRRKGKWPGSPKFRINTVDDEGNAA